MKGGSISKVWSITGSSRGLGQPTQLADLVERYGDQDQVRAIILDVTPILIGDLLGAG